MLLQISEPGANKAKPARRLAIGIDLGTTNSLAATVGDDGSTKVLSDAKGRALLPSVVRYHADGEIEVGSSVAGREPARRTAEEIEGRYQENDQSGCAATLALILIRAGATPWLACCSVSSADSRWG